MLTTASTSKTFRIEPVRISIFFAVFFISLLWTGGHQATAAPPHNLTAQGGTIYYVKPTATGTGDGLSWANATTLQDALATASSGAEIWVAKGLYKPTSGSDITVSFNLVPGTAVYGGFDPDSGADTFPERDWVAYPTVLSGDLGGDDITDANGIVTNWANIQNLTSLDNSLHIVVADGTTGTPITSSTRLDGFTITAGYASGDSGLESSMSGGFYCLGSGAGNDCSPSLTNVTFSGNRALIDGGAMFNDGGNGGSSSPTLTAVTFSGNKAGSDGGGMYNGGGQGGSSSPTLSGVTFDSNEAGWGGGMYNDGYDNSDTSPGSSSPTLTNVNFTNNSAEFDGGAMFNDGSYDAYDGSSSNDSSPTLNTVTFTNNSAGRDGGAMFNDGRNYGHSSPTLNTVTFTDNVTTDKGGAMFNAGGHVGSGSPTLSDVIFDNNSASDGGALFNDGRCSGESSPILNRVTFTNNSATTNGGAIFNNAQNLTGSCGPGNSSPILTNVNFTSNSAAADGGAIYNNFECICINSPILTNVSFSLNSADQGGALYNNAFPGQINNIPYRSTTVLTNVILWGDSAASAGPEIYNDDTDLTISYSVIEGGIGTITNTNTGTITDGGNNQTSDPLYINANAGDLQLPSGSPAVDTGNDTACPATDLLSVTRPQGMQCDIGAYEYIPPFFTVTFNANGGSGSMTPQTYNSTTNLTSNSFTRTDYTFIGWNTAANGTGTVYADGAAYDFTADLDLFAQWSFSADFVITVKTDNAGTSSNTQFTIPTTGSGYNYNVDCNNDGTDEITGHTSSTGYTCDYGPTGLNTGAGTYTIRIKDNSGLKTGFPRIHFNYSGDRRKLLTIQQWGTGKWTSMLNAFDGCENLTINATDSPDLSNLTDLRFMFHEARSLTGDIGNWDTSNVTKMSYMFGSAIVFNADIGGWETGNVTEMISMFQYATAFNADISSWDTSKVTRMDYMFIDADAFNQDISGWLTGNVTNLNSMFQNTAAFDQNLGAWDVSKVTTASNMFGGKALSTPNYDALLIGWDAQTLKPNVSFGGGHSRYCHAQTEHDHMTSPVASGGDGWIISDFGLVDCHTVTFLANGGSGNMSPQVSGVPLLLTPNTFTRAGYAFSGWNTAADGSGTPYADNAYFDFSADLTLYAQWSLIPLTVTFDANGGSGTMAPQTSTIPANLTSNTFTRTGHTFTGWDTAPDGSGTPYADNAVYPFAADATLYAQWSIDTYTVTFDANGGSGSMDSLTKKYNVALNLTANAFTRTGHTFTGWNTAADGSGTGYANQATYVFTGDVNLYAQWNAEETAVAPALTMHIDGSFIWQPDQSLCTESLHRSELPYGGFSWLTDDPANYDGSGSLTSVGLNYFYYLNVDCGVGGTAVSNTVGEFTFTIVPGS